MNFLNPSVLFALGAAALPLIIHFLSRRRAKDVPFPSIELLERMKTESIRRLRLKQFLLIAIRTLIILAIVLAFARPVVNGLSGSVSSTSALIILDDSASMRYVHNGEMLFDQAKRAALEILGTLNDRDDAAVMLAASGEFIDGAGLSGDINDLEKRLSVVECSMLANRPDGLFSKAVNTLSGSVAPNRELFYVGDGVGDVLPDSISANDAGLHAYAVFSGPSERSGLSVESLMVQNPVLQPGRPVTVAFSGKTGAGTDVSSLEFFVDSERIGRKAPDTSGGVFTGEFEFTPEVPGLYSLMLQGDNHRFEAGESVRTVVNVPERIRVLIVGDTVDDSYFVSRALLFDDQNPPFEMKAVTAAELNRNLIGGADVIVFSSVTGLDDGLYATLATTVIEHGSGLLVFPPLRSESELYTGGIFRDLAPVTVENAVNAATPPEVTIESFDLTHPMLGGILLSGNFSRPKVSRAVSLRPLGDCDVLARFDDRSPAALLFESGNGKVVLFSPGTLSDSGDFPLTGIFPSMLLRAVQYCAPLLTVASRFETGMQSDIRIPGAAKTSTVSIQSAEGPARSVEFEIQGGDIVLHDVATDKAGFYSVFDDTGERARYSVDIPSSEKRLNRSGTEMRIRAYNGIPFEVINAGSNLGEEIVRQRIGSEIAWLFYLLAAILFAAEMIIARKA